MRDFFLNLLERKKGNRKIFDPYLGPCKCTWDIGTELIWFWLLYHLKWYNTCILFLLGKHCLHISMQKCKLVDDKFWSNSWKYLVHLIFLWEISEKLPIYRLRYSCVVRSLLCKHMIWDSVSLYTLNKCLLL